MAKKQTFGDKALQAKQGVRKMAKVIVAKKRASGSYGYSESIIDVNDVNDFLAKNK
jgi:hypothetical protein